MDGKEIGYLDLVIYEKLFNLLTNYLPQADCQQVVSELREELPVVNVPSLKVIHQTTLNCEKCPNLNHDAALPKWNLVDPDLLIVLPTPSLSNDASEILLNALKNSEFSSSRCALTYAIRCTSSNKTKQDKSEMINCSNYLLGEISHLKPKLIMLLGKTSALTFNKSFEGENVSEMSGIINWLGPWAYMIIESPEYIAFKNTPEIYETYFKNAFSFCYRNSS
jgi:uracil-DNA glycosylase